MNTKNLKSWLFLILWVLSFSFIFYQSVFASFEHKEFLPEYCEYDDEKWWLYCEDFKEEDNAIFSKLDGLKNVNLDLRTVKKVTSEMFKWAEEIEKLSLTNAIWPTENFFKDFKNLKEFWSYSYDAVFLAIIEITKDTFVWLDNVEKLYIMNPISKIEAWSFENMKNLKDLRIRYKRANSWENCDGVFRGLENLWYLEIYELDGIKYSINNIGDINIKLSDEEKEAILERRKDEKVTDYYFNYERNWVLKDLKNLKTLNIYGEHLNENLKKWAFEWLENLEVLRIYDTTFESIEEDAFENTQRLKRIIITPESLDSFKWNPFKKLKNLYFVEFEWIWNGIKTSFILDRMWVYSMQEEYCMNSTYDILKLVVEIWLPVLVVLIIVLIICKRRKKKQQVQVNQQLVVNNVAQQVFPQPQINQYQQPIQQQPIQQPVNQNYINTVQQPVQNPAPIQQPMQQVVQQPQVNQYQQPIQEPVNQNYVNTIQQPVQNPAPIQQPMQQPVQQPQNLWDNPLYEPAQTNPETTVPQQ